MPRNAKMRTRAEILSALRFVRNRRDAERAKARAEGISSSDRDVAAALAERHDAEAWGYEYILHLDHDEALPLS